MSDVPKRCRWFGHKPGVETWPIMVCWCVRCGTRCDKRGKPMPEPSPVASLLKAATDAAWADGYNRAIADRLNLQASRDDGEVPW